MLPSMTPYKGKLTVHISLEQTILLIFSKSRQKCKMCKTLDWMSSSFAQPGLQLLSSAVALLNFTAVSPGGGGASFFSRLLNIWGEGVSSV